MVKSFPQNFAAFLYFSLPVRCQAVCSTATSRDSPMVTGTNRKW